MAGGSGHGCGLRFRIEPAVLDRRNHKFDQCRRYLPFRLRPETDRNNLILLNKVSVQIFEPLDFQFHDDGIHNALGAIAAVFAGKQTSRFTHTRTLELRLPDQLAWCFAARGSRVRKRYSYKPG